MERPALAAEEEDTEEEGEESDSQIIDLEGINGKKLAVLLLSLALFPPPSLCVVTPCLGSALMRLHARMQ